VIRGEITLFISPKILKIFLLLIGELSKEEDKIFGRVISR